MSSTAGSVSVRIERILPSTFTYKDALELAWVYQNSFTQYSFGKFVAGPTYKVSSPPELARQYLDINDRLKASVQQAKRNDIAIRGMAQFLFTRILQPGWDAYVMRNDQGSAIGISVWIHPKYMQDQLDHDLGKDKLGFKVRRFVLVWWQWLKDVIRRGRLEHPFENFRLREYVEAHKPVHNEKDASEEELNKMTEQELMDAQYPFQYTLHCIIFCMLPEYQRKGLGVKFMNECISRLPLKRPVFSTAVGPQKLNLWATDQGLGMYKKCGYVPATNATCDHGYITSSSTNMYLTRF